MRKEPTTLPGRPARRVRVLTLVDEPAVRRQVEELLWRPHVEIVWVSDAAAGLALQEILRFDLIVLQESQPRIDGVSYLRATRKRGALCSACPLFMLASPDRVERLEGMADRPLTRVFSGAVNGSLGRAVSGVLGGATRLAERLLVEVTSRSDSSFDRVLLQSSDVSESGLFLSTGQPLALAGELSLAMTLPEDGRAVEAEVAVVRRVAVGAGRSGVGLRFLRFEADGRERLARFLQNRLEQETHSDDRS